MKMHTYRLERWANSFVAINVGLLMHSAQAANKALRRCAIGNVTRKVEPKVHKWLPWKLKRDS
jgi:hypothetical protein